MSVQPGFNIGSAAAAGEGDSARWEDSHDLYGAKSMPMSLLRDETLEVICPLQRIVWVSLKMVIRPVKLLEFEGLLIVTMAKPAHN
jgi:hypothetical protein